jgi:lipopolysaccharide export system permease protein
MASYRRIRFTTHRIVMDVQGFDFERSSESMFSRGDRELSAQEMRVIVDSLQRMKDGIEAGIRATMTQDFQRLVRGAVDTGAPPFSRLQLAEPPALLGLSQGRTLMSTVTTSLFRLESVDREMDQYLVEIYKKYSIPTACLVFVLVGAPLGIMARRGGFGIAATLSLGFFVLYWACLIGGEKLADRDILSPFLGMWSANIIIGAMGILLTIRIGRETVVINWDFLQKYIPRRWRSRLEGESAQAE